MTTVAKIAGSIRCITDRNLMLARNQLTAIPGAVLWNTATVVDVSDNRLSDRAIVSICNGILRSGKVNTVRIAGKIVSIDSNDNRFMDFTGNPFGVIGATELLVVKQYYYRTQLRLRVEHSGGPVSLTDSRIAQFFPPEIRERGLTACTTWLDAQECEHNIPSISECYLSIHLTS